MVLIQAIIRPERLDPVREALEEVGVTGITVTEAMGSGHEPGRMHQYRGIPYMVAFHTRIKLEMVVPDWIVDPAVRAILSAARTGQVGDGKVFLLPVCAAFSIRSGEEGNRAIV
jgi:nitrogen regulatory protein P-II 1